MKSDPHFMGPDKYVIAQISWDKRKLTGIEIGESVLISNTRTKSDQIELLVGLSPQVDFDVDLSTV